MGIGPLRRERNESVEEVNYEELTVKEIQELLDEEGTEYDSKMKKADLIELLKE